MKTYKLFIFAVACSLSPYILGLSIIIPGTWSNQSAWHQPGNVFFDTLESELKKKNDSVFTFNWSGKNTHAARYTAAYNLANLIESFDHVTIIAHSHGTNVAILASHILKERKSSTSIDTLYALGTPIDINNYYPNMDVIQQFFNIFSFSDPVQTILGFFERTYPEHPHIANLGIMINDKEPSHSGIHNEHIALWIPHIATIVPQNAQGMICFYDQQPPLYKSDTFKERIERDRKTNYHLTSMFRSRTINDKDRT